MSSTAGGSCYDPSSSSPLLYYSQAALAGLGGSHGNLQDPMHMRSNMLYSNCSGGLPNIILTGESDWLVLVSVIGCRCKRDGLTQRKTFDDIFMSQFLI